MDGFRILQQIGESFGTRPSARNKGEDLILGFLQQIGESFGIRPKASSKSEDLISGRFDGLRSPAANRRQCRNSPEGNGWRVEELIWVSTKNSGNKKSRGWISYFLVFWQDQKHRK